MTAQIIDGKQVAADMRAELKDEVAKLKEQGIVPGLGVILVGEDPASQSYVTAKERACENIGIYSDDNRLPADTSQEKLMVLVDKMNNDPKINGILVQLPLPKGLNEADVLLAIDPAKDVDGFHPMNVGKMMVGEKAFLPCTPHGIIQLLLRSGVTIESAEVVIVGRSNIVGKPLANMLIQKKPNANATVTVCHTRTKDLPSHTKRADIVIAAAGRPNTVTADMIKGEREVATLASVLRLSGNLEIEENTIERQCDVEFFDTIKQQVQSVDAILSMACGVGVQMVAKVFPDMPVYPALNTKFMGTNDEAGQWSENCLACGDCKLGIFGGVCPVTKCSKSLLNGPCGGSIDGMCEVDPDNIECGWQLIYDRLKTLGKLDVLTENAQPRDWSRTHDGGPRKLSREDVAGL